MYNTNVPPQAELPTSRQLLRSTVTALVAAFVILVTIVLPAEHAIDPTGVGRVLGLTEMGQIKGQLAQEAAMDAEAAAQTTVAARASQMVSAIPQQAPSPAPAPAAAAEWRDEMQITLAPGEGSEIKLTMKSGEQAEFSWIAEGGTVNFDTHGDGGGQAISYEKGRNVASDEGVLKAAFDGNHGWFWRNRGDSDVNVIIRARGEYTQMKRAM